MKKYTLIFTTFSLILANTIFAQTNVSGGIFSEETWSLENSPYVVTDNVVVFPDGALTIEAGVVVEFTQDAIIELRAGDLYANGTENARITFTKTTNASTWGGIVNTANASQSIQVELDYVTFEYAETAIDFGAGTATRNISNAIFRNNTRGIYDGGWGYNWINVYKSVFLNNDIGMEGRQSAFDCRFVGNEVGFANPMTFANINSGADVYNCTFFNNDIAVGTIGQAVTIAKIKHCTFINNDKGFYGYWAIIDSTLFSSSSELAVYAQKGEIQNAFFSENEKAIEISLYPFQLSIHDNIINENETGLVVSGSGASIYNNQICNNSNFAVQLNTAENVDLNNNCWCLDNVDSIALAIEDAYDDVSLGIADFSTFTSDCSALAKVYPGDANHDGLVNTLDVLQIGLAYDLQGFPRPNSTSTWQGDIAADWNNTLANQVNAKHADCNGDGVVNEEDMEIVMDHYNYSHNAPISYQALSPETTNYSINIAQNGTLEAGSIVQYTISVESNSNPEDLLRALNFNIKGNASFYEPNSLSLSFNDSWLFDDEETLSFIKENDDQSSIDFNFTNKKALPLTGNGKVLTISFILAENASTFQINDIQLFDLIGRLLVSETTTSIDNPFNPKTEVTRVYPNPTKGQLFIQTNSKILSLALLNTHGQTLIQQMGDFNMFDLSVMQSGIYQLIIKTEENTIQQQIFIRKE